MCFNCFGGQTNVDAQGSNGKPQTPQHEGDHKPTPGYPIPNPYRPPSEAEHVSDPKEGEFKASNDQGKIPHASLQAAPDRVEAGKKPQSQETRAVGDPPQKSTHSKTRHSPTSPDVQKTPQQPFPSDTVSNQANSGDTNKSSSTTGVEKKKTTESVKESTDQDNSPQSKPMASPTSAETKIRKKTPQPSPSETVSGQASPADTNRKPIGTGVERMKTESAKAAKNDQDNSTHWKPTASPTSMELKIKQKTAQTFPSETLSNQARSADTNKQPSNDVVDKKNIESVKTSKDQHNSKAYGVTNISGDEDGSR